MPTVKRSLTLAGHRTSVSLEAEFWDAFRKCARERGVSLNALAAKIDADRIAGKDEADNLSSSIRLYILADLQRRLLEGDA